MVTAVAEELGLKIQSPDAVQMLYDFWMAKGRVRGKGNTNVDNYYTNLLDLCIIARHREQDPERYNSLENNVVMKWQETDYKDISGLPDLSLAIKAFQWLPDSSICGWITIMFSFLWTTHESETYQKFRQDLDNDLEIDAIAHFLHTIALTRCSYTKGNDLNVLPMWCDVHHHPKGGLEEEKCIKFRDSITNNLLANELEKKYAMDLAEAKKLIAQNSSDMKTNRPGRPASNAQKRKPEVALGISPMAKRKRRSSRHGRG